MMAGMVPCMDAGIQGLRMDNLGGWPDRTLQKQTKAGPPIWPSRGETGRHLYHLKEMRSFWVLYVCLHLCLPCFPNPAEITAEI